MVCLIYLKKTFIDFIDFDVGQNQHSFFRSDIDSRYIFDAPPGNEILEFKKKFAPTLRGPCVTVTVLFSDYLK